MTLALMCLINFTAAYSPPHSPPPPLPSYVCFQLVNKKARQTRRHQHWNKRYSEPARFKSRRKRLACFWMPLGLCDFLRGNSLTKKEEKELLGSSPSPK